MIVPAYKTLFVVNPVFFSQLTCCLASIIGIGCCQADADSAFVDLEPQTALFVIVGLLAQFRELGCVFKQPLF